MIDDGVRADGAERPWDRFLTERDRLHLAATWAKQGPRGFGSRPALMIVDDYYGSVGDRREPLLESVKRWPMSCGLEGWAAIDATVPLLAAARQVGCPVVFSTGAVGFPDNWVARVPEERPEAEPAQAALFNQIVAELSPRPDEYVVEKVAPSMFQGTPLEFYLNSRQVDTLIVCGETTSGCVRATVVDGATFRYRMGVVMDCCFDRTEASHAMSLFDLHHKYADVLDANAAIRYLHATR